ncbi:MAG: glycosyltransferase [Armatimonadota bacterium]|nr:glycosyltransferase [Armatimonadota bacterium]MDR7453830.1 glycosyltransferase [Armatimonadota bacterium]MDR7495921.1 glycosyltransferase [Armatimonadota bacterium]MDR7512560.1 glycosyltransferase [Armatimonadota bacterium]
MPERGHFQRVLPLIRGLADRGTPVVVYTATEFQAATERAGGRFADLFGRFPLGAADATSRPVPCRYVTFAAHYAEALIQEMVGLRPSVIVYDTFAVIGFLLGRVLGVPYVNVCAGHGMTPAVALRSLADDRRVAPSEACWRAVEVLRDRWGIAEAGPFAYFTGVSPYLNVYCEPPEFLNPVGAAAFHPIVYFGSLFPDARDASRPSPDPAWDGRDGAAVRVYASFGSVVWRYFAEEAAAALEAFADAIAALAGARALISLGGHGLPAVTRTRLERSNVRVADYVDQWNVLRDATACLTHNGLNSTHEMIYHGVPMISYPFFADQPALAARCQAIGCAVPLVGAVRGAVAAGDVRAALDRVREEASSMAEALARARAWELEVIAARPAAIQRILDLRRGAGEAA